MNQQNNEEDSYKDIAKKIHNPPVEHEMPLQGSQGMDREQLRLYKKK